MRNSLCYSRAEDTPLSALGAGCLANIASLVPRSRQRRFTHKREAATLQLGWGIQFAHCCRGTFDAVKLAHINHLWAIKDITHLRHPLYLAERPRGRPPFRLDQAIHLITRIKTSSNLGTQWSLRTSQLGIAHSFAYVPTCPYQHHSGRRSLVLQDQHLEDAQWRNTEHVPTPTRRRDDLALGEAGQAAAMGGKLESTWGRRAALSASPPAFTLKGPLPRLGQNLLPTRNPRGDPRIETTSLPLSQPSPQVGEACGEQEKQRGRGQEKRPLASALGP
jgi:hypothetical protein